MADVNVTAKWIEEYIHFDIEEDEVIGNTMIYIRCEYCDARFGSFEPGLYRPHDYVTNAVLHYVKAHPKFMTPPLTISV